MEVDFFLPSAEHVRATAMHVKREEVRMTRRVKKTLKLTTKKTASLLMACFGAPESQEWWDVAEKVIDFIWTTGESEAVCCVDRGTEEATEVRRAHTCGHSVGVVEGPTHHRVVVIGHGGPEEALTGGKSPKERAERHIRCQR